MQIIDPQLGKSAEVNRLEIITLADPPCSRCFKQPTKDTQQWQEAFVVQVARQQNARYAENWGNGE